MKIILQVFILIVFVRPVLCQVTDRDDRYTVNGKVTNKNGTALENVSINIINLIQNVPMQGFTDNQGEYRFTNLKKGKYLIVGRFIDNYHANMIVLEEEVTNYNFRFEKPIPKIKPIVSPGTIEPAIVLKKSPIFVYPPKTYLIFTLDAKVKITDLKFNELVYIRRTESFNTLGETSVWYFVQTSKTEPSVGWIYAGNADKNASVVFPSDNLETYVSIPLVLGMLSEKVKIDSTIKKSLSTLLESAK